ncbi:tryptophan-rich sensory protein [Patescibacteria group bacterium]|nr:tryptophan-rich sensory protein [Patescibacteria group bacterium]
MLLKKVGISISLKKFLYHNKNMRRTLSLVVSLLLAYSAAFIGSIFTVGTITTWYATLARPTLSPPNWLFGPVWTILYALMAIAAWRIYEKKKGNKKTMRLLWIYVAHLAVNAFWSISFFGLHSPALALAIIAVLWLLIVYLMVSFYRVDRTAGLLLVPYLAWVSFASYLNLSIVLLN